MQEFCEKHITHANTLSLSLSVKHTHTHTHTHTHAHIHTHTITHTKHLQTHTHTHTHTGGCARRKVRQGAGISRKAHWKNAVATIHDGAVGGDGRAEADGHDGVGRLVEYGVYGRGGVGTGVGGADGTWASQNSRVGPSGGRGDCS